MLAGRDPEQLQALSQKLNNAHTVCGPLDSLLNQMHAAAPAVVVNTVGPFAETTKRVLSACPSGTHAVDIANELPAVGYALDQHQIALEAGTTIVTGAGFGVLATESLVVKMCAEWPRPTSVRVDAMASLAVTDGVMGTALAGSILSGLPDGGRVVEGGRLVRSPVANHAQHLTAPNGDMFTTAILPTGDLIAAWRASGAAAVMSASSMIPSGMAVRAVLPAASFVARAGFVRRFAIARLAKVRLRAEDMPREFSWGHCAMDWRDGTHREAWLRIGDAQEFTIAATAEIAHRLTTHDVRPGAFTPASLFGPSLAEGLGATYVM